MVFGPVFEILPAEHVDVKVFQVSGFNSSPDSPNSIEIVLLLLFDQMKKGYDVPSWDHQRVPGIHRVSVEDSHKRPVFKDKGVGFAP